MGERKLAYGTRNGWKREQERTRWRRRPSHPANPGRNAADSLSADSAPSDASLPSLVPRTLRQSSAKYPAPRYSLLSELHGLEPAYIPYWLRYISYWNGCFAYKFIQIHKIAIIIFTFMAWNIVYIRNERKFMQQKGRAWYVSPKGYHEH